MKKILFFLILCFSYFLSFSQIGSEELSTNRNFKAYITNISDFVQILNKNLTTEESKELEIFFKDANNQAQTLNDQIELIKEKFKLSNSEIFVNYCLSSKQSLDAFQEEFGSINELNKDTLALAISKMAPEGTGGFIGGEVEGPCDKWGLRFCAASAFLECGMMLNGCLAMVGVSAGTLTPAGIACVAAVSVILKNKLNECKKNNCPD